jgi:hypothetical protein
VSLAELSARQGAYEGRVVETEGTVRAFDDAEAGHRYYVIEDAEAHRVGIRPADVAAPHLSRQVRLSGTFGVDPREGRFIVVARIAPLHPRGGGS